MTYPVDLAGTRRTIEIRGGAYATLDNLVVGFRPEARDGGPAHALGDTHVVLEQRANAKTATATASRKW